MKYKKDSLYIVEFLDHSKGGDLHTKCRVCGFYIKDNGESHLFTYWVTLGEDKDEPGNTEYMCILKNCITKSKLIPWKKSSSVT